MLTQNKGLKAISSSFQATLIKELKTETFIALINILLKEQRVVYFKYIYYTPIGNFIKAQCLKVYK